MRLAASSTQAASSDQPWVDLVRAWGIDQPSSVSLVEGANTSVHDIPTEEMPYFSRLPSLIIFLYDRPAFVWAGLRLNFLANIEQEPKGGAGAPPPISSGFHKIVWLLLGVGRACVGKIITMIFSLSPLTSHHLVVLVHFFLSAPSAPQELCLRFSVFFEVFW